MLTLDVLSKRLAFSEWQTRRLVYALRPLLQGSLASKPGQALQIPSSAIGLFERAAQLKSEGIALGSLAQALQEEMGPTAVEAASSLDGVNVQPPPLDPATPLAAEPWRVAIAAKDETIRALQAEVVHLRGEVERLLPLALPAPRRIFGLFRRSRATAAA